MAAPVLTCAVNQIPCPPDQQIWAVQEVQTVTLAPTWPTYEQAMAAHQVGFEGFFLPALVLGLVAYAVRTNRSVIG